MKKAFLNLLVFFIFSALSIQAQSSLGIDAGNYSIPSPVNYGFSYSFSVHIKNYGPQPANAQVDLMFVIDSAGTPIPANLSGIDTANSHFVIMSNVPVNGEVLDSTTVTIDSSNGFRSGINTVVIWPRSDASIHVSTHDTLRVQVLVVGRAGIENYTNAKPIVFPNPMQNRLFIANKDPNFVIEQVRIFDISGQLICSEKFKGSIDVSKLTSGVYTLEFTDLKGNTSRYKVIKE